MSALSLGTVAGRYPVSSGSLRLHPRLCCLASSSVPCQPEMLSCLIRGFRCVGATQASENWQMVTAVARMTSYFSWNSESWSYSSLIWCAYSYMRSDVGLNSCMRAEPLSWGSIQRCCPGRRAAIEANPHLLQRSLVSTHLWYLLKPHQPFLMLLIQHLRGSRKACLVFLSR